MNDLAIHNKKPLTHQRWSLRQPYSAKTVAIILVAVIVLAFSARHSEIDKAIVMTAEGAADAIGLVDDSDVGRGAERYFTSAFPIAIADTTDVARIENFDRDNLPFLSHIETRTEQEHVLNPISGQWDVEETTKEVLVEPLGYLFYVFEKMFESIEIALWGTILAIVLGIPLAFFAAKNYSPHPILYGIARTTTSFFRAIPELVSALFLVLAYGFGPTAGIIALGVHTAGFLGKMYADDIENADRGPQEALISLGANKVKVLTYAVLPQVLPQYIAYTQYILERNVRMAVVIGIVGAGGIGIELKGRYDMFNFGHVTTILLVIFLTVFVLERVSQWLRAKVI